MSQLVAGATVFFTSGAVLVLEILALRLLTPYVGATLETYTAIIGTVLAGISAGTWIGGYLADRLEPRRLLGPLMVVGGALSLAAVPLVRILGTSPEPFSVVGLSLAGFFAPAAVLSAVSPTVVKLQLRDLAATGRIVGRLSALGTAGAITGTYVAGFFLVEAAPTTTSILAVGGAVMAVGTLFWLRLWNNSLKVAVVAAALGFVVTNVGVAVGDPCEVETTYHCARIVEDKTRPGGRLLVLDTVRHSYVDLDDPTHLEFAYARVFADVISASTPAGPLRVLHVGGGGFTLPGYLRAVRPGSVSTVLEIDPGLLRLSQDRLGLRTGPDLDVRIGDARLLIQAFGDGGHDVVVGDAFGGRAVPWHLTTVEFLSSVRASLRPGGLYVMNLIDYPPMRFLRAEIATLARVFDHVAVVADRAVLDETGGNVVLVATDGPLNAQDITARIADRDGDEEVLSGAAVGNLMAGVSPLTDDWAPVDQWLARARARPR